MATFSASQVNQIALITSLITEELFSTMHKPNGAIAAHGKIVETAIKFEEEHRHITDWESYSESIGVCDWHECVVKYANEKLKFL